MAIYKRGRGFELGTTVNKSSKWPERDSNPGPPDFESDALTTRPRCLPIYIGDAQKNQWKISQPAGGGGGLMQFFFPGEFFYALPQFPAEKNVPLPLVWPKKVMTLPTLKDMTGIIKRDRLLPCALHNKKRVSLLPNLVQVATREELS